MPNHQRQTTSGCLIFNIKRWGRFKVIASYLSRNRITNINNNTNYFIYYVVKLQDVIYYHLLSSKKCWIICFKSSFWIDCTDSLTHIWFCLSKNFQMKYHRVVGGGWGGSQLIFLNWPSDPIHPTPSHHIRYLTIWGTITL